MAPNDSKPRPKHAKPKQRAKLPKAADRHAIDNLQQQVDSFEVSPPLSLCWGCAGPAGTG